MYSDIEIIECDQWMKKGEKDILASNDAWNTIIVIHYEVVLLSIFYGAY